MEFRQPTKLSGCVTMDYLTRSVLSWETNRRYQDDLLAAEIVRMLNRVVIENGLI